MTLSRHSQLGRQKQHEEKDLPAAALHRKCRDPVVALVAGVDLLGDGVGTAAAAADVDVVEGEKRKGLRQRQSHFSSSYRLLLLLLLAIAPPS